MKQQKVHITDPIISSEFVGLGTLDRHNAVIQADEPVIHPFRKGPLQAAGGEMDAKNVRQNSWISPGEALDRDIDGSIVNQIDGGVDAGAAVGGEDGGDLSWKCPHASCAKRTKNEALLKLHIVNYHLPEASLKAFGECSFVLSIFECSPTLDIAGESIDFVRKDGILVCSRDDLKPALLCCFSKYDSVRKLQDHMHGSHKHLPPSDVYEPRKSRRAAVAEKRRELPLRFDDRVEPTHIHDQPDAPNCLVDDDLLKKITAAVNPKYRILICLLCHFAIPPNQLINHANIAGHHHHPKLTEEDVALLVKHHNLFPNADLPPPRGHTEPVAGLALHTDAFQCQFCGHVMLQPSTRANHMSIHSNDSNKQWKFWEEGCWYQQLFVDRRRWFRVYPDAVEPTDWKNYFEEYLPVAEAALELKPDLIPSAPPKGMKAMASVKAWPETLGWTRAVEGYQFELLAEMVSLSKDDHIMSVLKIACHQFMDDMGEAAQNTNDDVRRWLLSCTPYVFYNLLDLTLFLMVSFLGKWVEKHSERSRLQNSSSTAQPWRVSAGAFSPR
jgi:hypothetical protein